MIYWILIGIPGYGIRVSIVSVLLNMHHIVYIEISHNHDNVPSFGSNR